MKLMLLKLFFCCFLFLLESKLKVLSTAIVKLKLIKVQAVKLQDVQQAGGKAMVSSPP